jgi:hypothetical protein
MLSRVDEFERNCCGAKKVTMSAEFAKLFSKVEDALESGQFADDIQLAAKVEVGLAELLIPMLDQEQLAALSAAKEFWSGQAENQIRLRYLERLSERQDRYLSPTSKMADVNRLVFSCLTNNTGLSPYLGEYLVGLAENAGLTAEQVSRVFASHVPSFASD